MAKKNRKADRINRGTERIKKRTERVKKRTAKIKDKTAKAKKRTMEAKGLQEPTGPAPKLGTKSVGAKSPAEPIKSIEKTKGVGKSSDMSTSKAVSYYEADKRKGKNTNLIGEIVKNSAQREYGIGSRNFENVSEEGVTTPEEFAKIEKNTTIDNKDAGTATAANIAKNAKSTEELASRDAIKEQVNKGVEELNESIDAEDESIASNLAKTEEEVNEQKKKSIADYAQEGAGYTLPYSEKYTDEEIEKAAEDFRQQRMLKKLSAPGVVLEKLQVQDYFPPQTEFLKSNFTGRYIGSREIVSNVPARIPVGLYDARNRALQEKAKKKKEALDEIKGMMRYETAEQFQQRFNDYATDKIFDYINLAEGDIEGLLDPTSKLSQMMYKDVIAMEDLAKSISETDTYVNQIIEDAQSKDGYVPPRKLKLAQEFHKGKGDLEALLKDGESASKILSTARELESYESFTNIANDRLDYLQKVGGEERYLAAGADWDLMNGAEQLEYAQNAMNAINEAQYSKDYDSFIQTISKYWDINKIGELVDGIYQDNRLYEGEGSKEEKDAIREDGVRYFVSQLPVKLENKLTHQANQHARMQAEYLRHKRFSEQQNDKTPYYDGIRKTAEKNGSYGAVSNAIRTTKAGSEERKAALIKAYELNGWGGLSGSGDQYGVLSGDISNFPDKNKTITVPFGSNTVFIKDGKGMTYSTLKSTLASERDALPEGSSERELLDKQIEAMNDAEQAGGISMQHNMQRGRFAIKKDGKFYRAENYDKEFDDSDVQFLNDFYGAGSYYAGPGKNGKDTYDRLPFSIIYSGNLDSDAMRKKFNSFDKDANTQNTQWHRDSQKTSFETE